MAKVRISTTVDEQLLKAARKTMRGANDARLMEEALGALVSRYRNAQIDASYAAYDEIPLSTPDEWGDLESFREAAGRS